VLGAQNGLLEWGTGIDRNGIERELDVLPTEKGLDIVCNSVYCGAGRLVTRGEKEGSLLGGDSRRAGEKHPENLWLTKGQRPNHHNGTKRC